MDPIHSWYHLARKKSDCFNKTTRFRKQAAYWTELIENLSGFNADLITLVYMLQTNIKKLEGEKETLQNEVAKTKVCICLHQSVSLPIYLSIYLSIYILHFTLVSIVTGRFSIHRGEVVDSATESCSQINVSYKLPCLQCKVTCIFTNNISRL